MTVALRRGLAALAVVLALPVAGRAATPGQIDAAVKRGVDYLRKFNGTPDGNPNHYPGVHLLAGLALLEAGVPADDPAVRAVAALARDTGVGECRTYHVALGVLFLDRLGDPADRPLIQLLGIRLVVGQASTNGWTYLAGPGVSPAELPVLRGTLRAAAPSPGRPPAPGLHRELELYLRHLSATHHRPDGDDNSNTQFGILGLWVARRHGVPVDDALAKVERRFVQTQAPSGGWPYLYNPDPAGEVPTPAMTCAGLLGLATAIARREERKLIADPPKAPPAAKGPRTADPFFPTPPKPAPPADEPKPPPKPAPAAGDHRDAAAARGLACLAGFLTAGRSGEYPLYFLWSVERVAVIYGLERIGGFDWYEAGADHLVRTQGEDGAWSDSGPLVGTSFALLFLTRSNLTRDLRARRDGAMEGVLRAGGNRSGAGWDVTPVAPGVAVRGKPPAPPADPVAAEAAALAAKLVAASDAAWPAAVADHRDSKGAVHTRTLVAAIDRVGGDRRKDVRDALAERLSRMTADTLRGMLAAPEPELRRAAALACGMKDDKAHVGDLIPLLTDRSDVVWPAAKGALKSLTGVDHGPAVTATPADRERAAAAWRAWHGRQPK